MNKKNKKRKIRLRGLLVILLGIYLIITCAYYLFKMPIKNIEINGNQYYKDNYIINYLNLDNTSIFKVSKSKIKKELLKLDLISDVKIRKNYLGSLTLDIKEERILFYNLSNKKVILSSGKMIDDNNYLGIPTLINYVPEDIYQEFVQKLSKIDSKILKLVSEIEYSVSMVDNKVIDDKRFLFRMNDGNTVYINTINIEKINNYVEIYEAIVNKNGNVKGCLYLDSNSDNNHFNNCEEKGDGGEN